MLVLASSSPRRQQLLAFFGIDFQIQPADVDESLLTNEKPQDYVIRLARKKASSIKPNSPNQRIVIAADTAVVDGGQILGKPENALQAAEMLRNLSGRSHNVYTGLAGRDVESEWVSSDLCITQVHMRDFNEAEIADYIASGDPMDKAGAYAIQNTGFNPVQKISGCYANVVGLPMCHLAEMLTRFNLAFPDDITKGCRSPHGYNCRLTEIIEQFSE
jgi:septum formation protein